MDPADVHNLLFEAAQLRFPPSRDEGGERAHPQQRIEALEDHYTECAVARGQLEEGALWTLAGVKKLEDEWDEIEGWETLAGGERTQKAIVAAKRKLRPELYDGIRAGKWLADKCRTQIRRLERDEEAASRLYTMMGAG